MHATVNTNGIVVGLPFIADEYSPYIGPSDVTVICGDDTISIAMLWGNTAYRVKLLD